MEAAIGHRCQRKHGMSGEIGRLCQSFVPSRSPNHRRKLRPPNRSRSKRSRLPQRRSLHPASLNLHQQQQRRVQVPTEAVEQVPALAAAKGGVPGSAPVQAVGQVAECTVLAMV